MPKTLFERIATKEISANLVYEDEHVVAGVGGRRSVHALAARASDATLALVEHATHERHAVETASPLATRLLASWKDSVSSFRKVMPRDYKAVLGVFDEAEKNGWTEEQTAERVMEVARG